MGGLVLLQYLSVFVFYLAMLVMVIMLRKVARDVEQVKKSMRALEDQIAMLPPRADAAAAGDRDR